MDERASRIELTPLTFLRRAAEALGERTAVVHGERRYDYAELAGALPPARVRAPGARDRAARPGGRAVPEHAGAARGPLRRPAGRRRPRGPEHAPEQRRDRLHPATTPAPACCSSTRSCSRWSRRRTSTASRPWWCRTRGRRTTRTSSSWPPARTIRPSTASRTRRSRSPSTTRPARPGARRARSTRTAGPTCAPTASRSRPAWATTPSTCGRCPCSTATGGA